MTRLSRNMSCFFFKRHQRRLRFIRGYTQERLSHIQQVARVSASCYALCPHFAICKHTRTHTHTTQGTVRGVNWAFYAQNMKCTNYSAFFGTKKLDLLGREVFQHHHDSKFMSRTPVRSDAQRTAAPELHFLLEGRWTAPKKLVLACFLW